MAANSRGCNYSADEDSCLARAWVHVSENPVIGSEQTGNTFYEKIRAHYMQMKPEAIPARPLASITTRVKLIVKNCVRFSACHSAVVRSRPTGVSDDDIIRISTALFNNKKIKEPTDDIGKPFKFLQSWLLLRYHQKFLAGESATSAKKIIPSDTECHAEESGCLSNDLSGAEKPGPGRGESAGRPVGRRKAKEDIAKDINAKKKLRLAEHAIKIQEERNFALARHNEILLFSNGPGGSDSPEAKEYFKLMQEEALIAARANARARRLEESRKQKETGENASEPRAPEHAELCETGDEREAMAKSTSSSS